jgi:hypothetical protein
MDPETLSEHPRATQLQVVDTEGAQRNVVGDGVGPVSERPEEDGSSDSLRAVFTQQDQAARQCASQERPDVVLMGLLGGRSDVFGPGLFVEHGV